MYLNNGSRMKKCHFFLGGVFFHYGEPTEAACGKNPFWPSGSRAGFPFTSPAPFLFEISPFLQNHSSYFVPFFVCFISSPKYKRKRLFVIFLSVSRRGQCGGRAPASRARAIHTHTHTHTHTSYSVPGTHTHTPTHPCVPRGIAI